MSPEDFEDLRRRLEFIERKMGLYVDDASLDRPKGDPRVNFVPRNWRGPDFKGQFYSKCSPEFLEVLAETLTWMADNPQEGKERFVAFNRRDAAKARSWARRLRRKAAVKQTSEVDTSSVHAASIGVANRGNRLSAGSDRLHGLGTLAGGGSEEPATSPPHDPATGEIFDFESQDSSFPENPFDDQEPFQFEESDHV